MTKKLVGNKKKLTPASIASRKPRKAAFLPSQEAYARSHTNVELGDYLGAGNYGAVFTVKGNPNMVVKVPNGFENTYPAGLIKPPKGTISERRIRIKKNARFIEREGDTYEQHGFEGREFLVPTRKVNIGNNGLFSRNYMGLLRPRLRVITDRDGLVDKSAAIRITRSQLEAMRQYLIQLTNEGYIFDDGLQVGIDSAGRLLIYDLGSVVKSENKINNYGEQMNNMHWWNFLKTIGKYEFLRREDGVVLGLVEFDGDMMSRLRAAVARKNRK